LERRNVAGQKKEGAYNALCKVYKRRVLGSWSKTEQISVALIQDHQS
jgi:hypothetical protein